ncbi:MAG: hypothetical protein B7X34_06820 [Acidobacteriia bacterium 12-62-4]|nr:MAG: hypothetical protein B7X34_06820 [Acidobacteriia bacterium 12-62-4]
MQTRVIILWLAALSGALAADPAYAVLEKAYAALRDRQFDEAVRLFDQATLLAPDRAAIRKDLAYTLLKIGETIAARDQFRRAMERPTFGELWADMEARSPRLERRLVTASMLKRETRRMRRLVEAARAQARADEAWSADAPQAAVA